MADRNFISQKKGKGQASRLSAQHTQRRGVVGIFGDDAKQHDQKITDVSAAVLDTLQTEFPNLNFRTRASIKKSEIHQALNTIDEKLGIKLFTEKASIRPDGTVMEVQDQSGAWRVILVGESKFQGNDIANIAAGYRTDTMERKGQFIMPAGNAIERVHKNIQEMKNFMLSERHFPYVVFLQGSNFATEDVVIEWPDGTPIPISPSDPAVNRIDRVTASNYGMEINQNYCKNLIVSLPTGEQMLQVTSIFAQAEPFSNESMFHILWDTAITSLEVLAEDLPKATT